MAAAHLTLSSPAQSGFVQRFALSISVAPFGSLGCNKEKRHDKLKVIAAELITQVRKSVTIDWTLREGARAKIRVMVKRILNKYGYPPDLQEEAVKTVLQQAELLCADWV